MFEKVNIGILHKNTSLPPKKTHYYSAPIEIFHYRCNFFFFCLSNISQTHFHFLFADFLGLLLEFSINTMEEQINVAVQEAF